VKRLLVAVISGTGLLGLLLSVPSSSMGAQASTPGCTAKQSTPFCFFVPSGTVISYSAHIQSNPKHRSIAVIREFDPTCTNLVSPPNVLLVPPAPASGTFTLNNAGDCVQLTAVGGHGTRITASG
jgi:hypothetical protein